MGAEQLGEPHLAHLAAGGVPLVEDVVGRDLTAERQRPAERRGRLAALAQVHLGGEQAVPRLAILGGLAREPDVVGH